MKNKIYVAALPLFFSCALLFAQAPIPTWQQVDGNNSGIFYSAIPTDDGGLIAVGWTSGPHHSADSLDQEGYHYDISGYWEEAWVVKRAADGTLEWGHCYGGTNGNSEAYAISKTSDGYIIGGMSEASNGDVPSNKGYEDAWYFKIDDNGNIIWTISYGTPSGYEQVNGITTLSDGNAVLCGEVGVYKDFAMKINNAGDTLWTRSYCGPNIHAFARKCIELPDESLMTGELFEDPTGADVSYFVLTHANSDGDTLWQKAIHIDATAEQGLYDFTRCSDGGYALTGTIQGVIDGVIYFPEIFVMRCDVDGNFLWEKTYGSSGYDFGYGIVQDADDNLIVGGYVETADTTFPQHNSQAYLLKLKDNDGSEIWFQDYPQQAYSFNDGLSSFHSLVKTSDGGMVAAGQYNCGHGYALDSLCMTSDGIEGYAVEFPGTTVSAIQNKNPGNNISVFPDPADDMLYLNIKQPVNFPLNIYIIDMNGKIVLRQQLISAQEGISVQSLSKGMYLYKVEGNNNAPAGILFFKQ